MATSAPDEAPCAPQRTPAETVRIVDLGRRHLGAVMAIDARVYPEPWSRRLWTLELERTRRIYLAAETGSGRRRDVVGFAGAMLSGDELHIMTIATDPSAQRTGIATRLLLEVVEQGLRIGATALTLEVRVSNKAAQSLYRRFGLAPAGVRRKYYEPEGEDALIMWVHDIDGPDYRARLDELGSAEARS